MGNIIEITREWIQMNDYERRVIALSHANGFTNNGITVTESHMMRLLDLGQPKCVFGYDGEQLKYSRIHKDSTEVMRVITNNYLIDPGIDGIEDFELIDDE